MSASCPASIPNPPPTLEKPVSAVAAVGADRYDDREAPGKTAPAILSATKHDSRMSRHCEKDSRLLPFCRKGVILGGHSRRFKLTLSKPSRGALAALSWTMDLGGYEFDS